MRTLRHNWVWVALAVWRHKTVAAPPLPACTVSLFTLCVALVRLCDSNNTHFHGDEHGCAAFLTCGEMQGSVSPPNAGSVFQDHQKRPLNHGCGANAVIAAA